jgi:hypothetical protein
MLVAFRLFLGAIGGVILTAGLRWVLGQFGFPLNWPDGTPVSWTIVIAAGVVLGVVNAAVQVMVDHRRTQRNRNLAEKQEWDFVENIYADPSEFRRTLSLFRRDSLKLWQRMTGTFADRPIDIFDATYTETTGSGKSRSTTTYVQTVYRFPQYGKTLCPFRLVPRSRMFRWLEGLLTSTETEFHPPADATEEQIAAFEKFRKQYQLSLDSIGVDTNLAPRVFHPYVIAWLSLHPGWVIESDQVDLLLWRTDERNSGEDRLVRLEETLELLKLFDAGERATETLGAVQIERKPHDPKSSLNKIAIMAFGVGLGMMAGFFTTVILMFTVLPLIPKGPWQTIAFAAMFFVPGVIGMISGLRFGYVHSTGKDAGTWSLSLLTSKQSAPSENKKKAAET